jgi:uncharacterized protein YdhG (YjbR/CyaY superfamily)
MSPTDGDRARHWPAIERRYGRAMHEWFAVLAEQEDQRYAPLMALLQEEHGFSRAHANALVQYVRGSVTSQRSTTLEGYLATAEPVGAATVRRAFEGLLARHPGTAVEIAWNQPFLVRDGRRLFSMSVLKGHLLAAPWSVEVLDAFRDQLAQEHGLTVLRKTFRLPSDWAVDTGLLDDLVAAELARTPA